MNTTPPDSDPSLFWERDLGFYREHKCGRIIYADHNWKCLHCLGCPRCGGVLDDLDEYCFDCGWTDCEWTGGEEISTWS